MSDNEFGPAIYSTHAENRGGANGESWVEGGMHVDVRSPLGENAEAGTNPEQLLALAWATCLSASARIVAGPGVEVRVRTRITLHQRLDGAAFEFRAHAELHFAGKSEGKAAELAAAAHARCPVSRMFAGKSSVSVAAV
ncbi:OsmC family protein [Gulosibacter chungangensis]|uniref:OsmC family peroxiredoxin n=1 Tax=Gulosibacter chungangensis TaxID=979746 RepID=A0A7J5BAA0_9MICO|nr:OsmC family protein [Gulosibacter chungangensis]KAB1642689.1 hypothetical protein F8O05_09520 [Gulosibacter chungangensis]